MSQRFQRHWVERGCIVAAVLTATLVCVLSYVLDRSRRLELASNGQIDLLKGNLNDRWSVFGALSAAEVRIKPADDGIVEVDILPNTPSWSDESSGVSQTVGLFSPGWYEFVGEFQAKANDSEGIGAQLELHSGRWRFIAKADSHSTGTWQKIDVYLRPSDSYPGAEVSCRFWASNGDRTGRALFRDMRFVKIVGTPPPSAIEFDLQRKERARLGGLGHLHNSSLGSAGAAVLFLATVVGICWSMLA
jgi:hypothetical protein